MHCKCNNIKKNYCSTHRGTCCWLLTTKNEQVRNAGVKILVNDSFTPRDESWLYGINVMDKLEHVFVGDSSEGS